MKLSEYIKGLQEVFEEHGDMDCYYSVDDEGNAYQQVNYNGEIRYLKPEEQDEYQVENLYDEEGLEDLQEYCEYDDEDIKKLIKVCLVN
ncbi:MAG: hypothetical protein WC966_12255 [Bradymonadales bacterium]